MAQNIQDKVTLESIPAHDWIWKDFDLTVYKYDSKFHLWGQVLISRGR